MPFTGSHVAAVLPFMRGGLVPSALVIGSMAPDLPYYLPIPLGQSATHSYVGVVTVDVAMGLVAFAIWQILLAPVVVAAAPRGLRARLAPRYPVAWRRHVASARAMALVVASVLIGAATHVLWDEFTHAGRTGTENIAWLAATHGSLPGYHWAQYASSLVGAILVAVAVARWWRRTRPMPDLAAQRIPALPADVARRVRASVVVAASAAGAAGLVHALLTDDGLGEALFRAASWGGGAGLLVATGVAIALRRQVERYEERRAPVGSTD